MTQGGNAPFDEPAAAGWGTMRRTPAEPPTPPAMRLLRHLRRKLTPRLRRASGEAAPRHRRGDYRATSHELFRIEDLGPERAIVERVRTGELIDVGVDELDELRPVRAAGDPGT